MYLSLKLVFIYNFITCHLVKYIIINSYFCYKYFIEKFYNLLSGNVYLCKFKYG